MILLNRTWPLVLILALGIAACGSPETTSTQPQDNMPDTAPDKIENSSVPAPKGDFKAFANLYSDLQLPILIEGGNLKTYWTDHPERKVSDADLKAFLVGTPGFPALPEAPRFAAYGRMNVGDGNLLLLTYQFEYGDHVIATTFSKAGKAIDGRRIVSIPEVPEAISQTAVLDKDGSLVLTVVTPTTFDEEGLPTDFKYEQEAWQITPAGKFEKQAK